MVKPRYLTHLGLLSTSPQKRILAKQCNDTYIHHCSHGKFAVERASSGLDAMVSGSVESNGVLRTDKNGHLRGQLALLRY